MKLDHIVLFLSDLKRCVPFYDQLLPLLGFEKLREHVFVNAEAMSAAGFEAPRSRNSPTAGHCSCAMQTECVSS